MPDEKTKRQHHDEDTIQEFIEWDYSDLKGNIRSLSVGGGQNGIYRVAVEDRNRVVHTLKIRAEHVDAYLATKTRVERLSADSHASRPAGKDYDRDREPR